LGGRSLCCVIVALLLTLVAGRAAAAPENAGRILSPAPGSCVHSGDLVTIRWTPLTSDVDEFELLLMLDGAGNRPVRLTVQLDPSRSSYRWRVPSLPTVSARIQIRFNRGEGEELGSTSGGFQIVASGTTALASLALRDGEWWVVTLGGAAVGPMSRPHQKLATGHGMRWPLEPMASQGERDHLALMTFDSAPLTGVRHFRRRRIDDERPLGHVSAFMPQRE